AGGRDIPILCGSYQRRMADVPHGRYRYAAASACHRRPTTRDDAELVTGGARKNGLLIQRPPGPRSVPKSAPKSTPGNKSTRPKPRSVITATDVAEGRSRW